MGDGEVERFLLRNLKYIVLHPWNQLKNGTLRLTKDMAKKAAHVIGKKQFRCGGKGERNPK